MSSRSSSPRSTRNFSINRGGRRPIIWRASRPATPTRCWPSCRSCRSIPRTCVRGCWSAGGDTLDEHAKANRSGPRPVARPAASAERRVCRESSARGAGSLGIRCRPGRRRVNAIRSCKLRSVPMSPATPWTCREFTASYLRKFTNNGWRPVAMTRPWRNFPTRPGRSRPFCSARTRRPTWRSDDTRQFLDRAGPQQISRAAKEGRVVSGHVSTCAAAGNGRGR